MKKILSLSIALFITTSSYASRIDIVQDGEAFVANTHKTFKGVFKAGILSNPNARDALNINTLEVSFKPLAQYTTVEIPGFTRYVCDEDFIRFSGTISFDDTIVQLKDFITPGNRANATILISSNPTTAQFKKITSPAK